MVRGRQVGLCRWAVVLADLGPVFSDLCREEWQGCELLHLLLFLVIVSRACHRWEWYVGVAGQPAIHFFNYLQCHFRQKKNFSFSFL